jgi:hypothetical protein
MMPPHCQAEKDGGRTPLALAACMKNHLACGDFVLYAG